MAKIKLENNKGWFDSDSVLEQRNFRNDPNVNMDITIYKTKNGNFITKYFNCNWWYKKSTQEEIDIFKNAYTFPPEEEQ